MKEDFLQFLWKYKRFPLSNLQSTEGMPLFIRNTGWSNPDEGPDFLQASIEYRGLQWEGSVEVHVKSSHWNLHQHANNSHYHNVILHLVYENDAEISYFTERKIPTLELKGLISPHLIQVYNNWQIQPNFIPCSDNVKHAKDPNKWKLYYEKWMLEKLKFHYQHISETLQHNNNNWEQTLFQRIAYVFGLKVNAEVFEQMANQIPLKWVQQNGTEEENVLALFMGKTGLLNEPQDEFQQELKEKYTYLKHKYRLNDRVFPAKFLRIRPSAFPTIRLALLANLYCKYPQLFQLVLQNPIDKNGFKLWEKVETHPYFHNHYTFGKESSQHPKKLSRDFIYSIMINAVIPMQFAYGKSMGQDIADILELYSYIPKEKNHRISQYENLGFPIESAFDSQALLHLYKNYCSQKKCLHCNIGLDILKNE